MPDPITLNCLIGPACAVQFLNTHIEALITQDLLPHETAERMVSQAVAASDPWTLAAGGQQWNLRPDADPDLFPAQLYVVRRDGGEFLAEDENGQQETLGLSILESYQLTHWYGVQ